MSEAVHGPHRGSGLEMEMGHMAKTGPGDQGKSLYFSALAQGMTTSAPFSICGVGTLLNQVQTRQRTRETLRAAGREEAPSVSPKEDMGPTLRMVKRNRRKKTQILSF